MNPRRARLLTATLLALGATTLSACSGDDTAPRSTASASPSASASASTPPAPTAGVCFEMAYDAAIAPTSTAPAVDCAQAHTTETFAVGSLDSVVDGHLLAVDSAHAQQQVASACPAALGDFVGGSSDALRLSMIRAVWFTPTVEQSDAGADWYRCDAVVLAGGSKLSSVKGSLRGALAKRTVPDRYAMCGTAAPDAQDFERVPCASKHSWRAIAVVPFEAGRYPGEAKVRAAGRTRCENAAADRAADPLAFEWGYEWPTKQQWDAGQQFGRCWAPDAAS